MHFILLRGPERITSARSASVIRFWWGDKKNPLFRKPNGRCPSGFLYAAAASASELTPASAAYKKNRLTAVFAKKGILFGGPERIRTAVGGFADLSLATRPQDQIRGAGGRPGRGCKNRAND